MFSITGENEQSQSEFAQEMVEIFLEEAGDILLQLEDDLLKLDQEPGNLDIINSVFRAMHTIKGSASLTGLYFISDFAHVLEDILDDLRKERLEIPESHMMVFLDSLDLFKNMLDSLDGEGLNELIERSLEVKELLSHLMALPEIPGENEDIDAKQVQEDGTATSEGADYIDQNNQSNVESDSSIRQFLIRMNFKRDIFSSGTDPLMLFVELEEKGTIKKIELLMGELPGLEKIDPYLLYMNWNINLESIATREIIEDIFIFVAEDVTVEELEASGIRVGNQGVKDNSNLEASHLSDKNKVVPMESGPLVNRKSVSMKKDRDAAQEVRTIRVDTEKLEQILNQVAELSIAQSRIKNIITTHMQNSRSDEVEYVFEEINKITRLLQEEVMRTSMVPIEGIFIRFQRMIRDLAREGGKDIQVEVSGKETELDRKVIEQITDPLKHMIRNSVDHGMEDVEERKLSGKNLQGKIWLRAYYKEGGIVIEVEDDGRGLDEEAIIIKAKERGLVADGQELRREEILRLPFLPGFSTAKKISDISGRGVGLDVVKTNIHALRGHVDLESIKGKGTKFIISLPLTLAIIDAMMVTVGEDRLLIPLNNIVEFIKLSEKDVSRVAGKTPVIHYRGQYVPVVIVNKLLGIKGRANDLDNGMLVIVQDQRRPTALMVDEIVGQEQVVIKSIKENMNQIEGVAGATIMGDGRVAMILDISAIIRMSTRTEAF